MANNRLFIVDPETGARFCIAKSLGSGWYCAHRDTTEKLDEWFDDNRADDLAWDTSGVTRLVLMTEWQIANQPEPLTSE